MAFKLRPITPGRKTEPKEVEGLQYDMTPKLLKRISQLEKENTLLKQLIAEKKGGSAQKRVLR